ncbi:hypothetical protein CLD22_24950, partial [Rubrivivax gelatinosus]|nr:hypothetical protein [Rubrivivax gelatinosus]
HATLKLLNEGYEATRADGPMTTLDWFFALRIASGAGSSVHPSSAATITRKLAAMVKADADMEGLLKLWCEIMVRASDAEKAAAEVPQATGKPVTKAPRRRRENLTAGAL